MQKGYRVYLQKKIIYKTLNFMVIVAVKDIKLYETPTQH